MITADSSTEEILQAIDEAGDNHPKHRPWDLPAEGETKSWVLPREIGFTSRRAQKLVDRLHRLVGSGLLERRYNVRMPRFRVKR